MGQSLTEFNLLANTLKKTIDKSWKNYLRFETQKSCLINGSLFNCY